MAIRIRLNRMGTIRKPFYRLVVMEGLSSRNGAYLEKIGYYNPIPRSAAEKVNVERAIYWLKKGAKPTEAAFRILKRCGVYKSFASAEK